MKAIWKDYPSRSDLVLVFGHVSAEVIDLGPAPDGSPAGTATWGILTHPFVAEEIVGTRDQAKTRAENILRGILFAATEALG